MSKRPLDIELVRCLQTLLVERSVTRTAARLNISQPAVSSALNRLRTIFNDALLVRVQGGMCLTSRAQSLEPLLKRVVTDLDLLVNEPSKSFNPMTTEGHVTIGATDHAQFEVLPKIVRRLRAQSPGLKIEAVLGSRETLISWMEEGKVDLGIGPPNVPKGRFHYRKLSSDHAVCIHSNGRSAKRPLTIAAFCERSHLMVKPWKPSFYDDALDRALHRSGLNRRIVAVAQSFLLTPFLIKNTDMIAILPSRLADGLKASAGISCFEPPIALPNLEIGIFWHDRVHRDPINLWLRQMTVLSFKR